MSIIAKMLDPYRLALPDLLYECRVEVSLLGHSCGYFPQL